MNVYRQPNIVLAVNLVRAEACEMSLFNLVQGFALGLRGTLYVRLPFLELLIFTALAWANSWLMFHYDLVTSVSSIEVAWDVLNPHRHPGAYPEPCLEMAGST